MKKILSGLLVMSSALSFANSDLITKSMGNELEFGKKIFTLDQKIFLDDLVKKSGDYLILNSDEYSCVIRPNSSKSYMLSSGDYKIIPIKAPYYTKYDETSAGFLHATLFGQGEEFYMKCNSSKVVGTGKVDCSYEDSNDNGLTTYTVSATCKTRILSAPQEALEMENLFSSMFNVRDEK